MTGFDPKRPCWNNCDHLDQYYVAGVMISVVLPSNT